LLAKKIIGKKKKETPFLKKKKKKKKKKSMLQTLIQDYRQDTDRHTTDGRTDMIKKEPCATVSNAKYYWNP